MKKTRKYIHLLLLFLYVTFTSCEDFALGNKFLQKPPSGDVTIDTIFSTGEYARRVLWYAYSKLPYGFSTGYNNSTSMRLGSIESLTDLAQSYVGYAGADKLYYPGLYNAGSEDYSAGESHATKYNMYARDPWKGIRHAWIFINNVDRVPDMTAEEKSRLKAEAKITIAVQYSEMLRHYGALPIVDHAITPKEMDLPARSTLQQTVDFTIRLLDEAIACKDLPWALPEDDLSNESGRMTRASAMGLKLRVLLFVASPLFNSDKPYFPGEASDRLLTWFGEYSEQRWKDAAKAGEDFFRALNQGGFYALVQKETATKNTFRQAFQDAYYTRGTTESLISVRRHFRTNNINTLMQSLRWGAWCPTKECFDMFPMANGDDFDWDNPVHRANPFINRDPRLCETILLDGDDFQGRKAKVYKVDSKDKENYPKGADWGLKGYLDSQSLATGIAGRKFALDRKGEYTNRVIHWPYLRLAEIYLAYAEALNECNRTDEAYQYINAIRKRVGLPELILKGEKDVKTEFREAVLRERACEFVWEENRFFDLIRWKREADFTKHLHGINVYRHKITGAYKFDFPQLPERAWQKPGGFSAKWYLSAFPDKEVNKGYGLIQNPGW